MIPQSNLIYANLEVVEDSQVIKTYRLTEESIKGYIENLEALNQSIYKELSTEKYEYPIYSFDFGIELESLIGKDVEYVQIELKRRITECLLKDSRIERVDNFTFENKGDELICTFNVSSIYGDLTIEKGVSI